MQKITLIKIIREEILRAVVFASTLFVLVVAGSVGIAYAADGGYFGEILNRILVKDWDDPTNDGTVQNCARLGGKLPSEYVQVPVGGFSCGGVNQCIYGISATGVPLCQ